MIIFSVLILFMPVILVRYVWHIMVHALFCSCWFWELLLSICQSCMSVTFPCKRWNL